MTSPNEYELGELVTVTGEFRNPADKSLIDPSVVFLKVTPPSGIAVTYQYTVGPTVIRDSLGKFHGNIDANAVGWWYYKWYSTGSGQAARKWSFRVVD